MAERTPIYEIASGSGATFFEEVGWLVPARFSTPAEEYRRCREGAALFDQSHRGKVQLHGADARQFLHRLCSNDVAGLPADRGCEAFLCNAKAKIVSHCLVFPAKSPAGAESLWLDVAPGMAEKTLAHLDHFLISEQVELLERTREFAQLHLAGPHAKQILNLVLHGDLGELQFLQHCQCRWYDASVHVRRVDLLGVEGSDLVCAAGDGARLWNALIAAGASAAGCEAYHSLRIEAGTPLYGVDMDENSLAMEVGRTQQAISYKKGCFPGQEPIVRARDLGHVNWTLRGLKIDGSTVPSRGAKLFRDNAEAGRVTSAALSPRFQAAVALGYVRRGSDATGTALTVAIEEGTRAATVASLPFDG